MEEETSGSASPHDMLSSRQKRVPRVPRARRGHLRRTRSMMRNLPTTTSRTPSSVSSSLAEPFECDSDERHVLRRRLSTGESPGSVKELESDGSFADTVDSNLNLKPRLLLPLAVSHVAMQGCDADGPCRSSGCRCGRRDGTVHSAWVGSAFRPCLCHRATAAAKAVSTLKLPVPDCHSASGTGTHTQKPG